MMEEELVDEEDSETSSIEGKIIIQIIHSPLQVGQAEVWEYEHKFTISL